MTTSRVSSSSVGSFEAPVRALSDGERADNCEPERDIRSAHSAEGGRVSGGHPFSTSSPKPRATLDIPPPVRDRVLGEHPLKCVTESPIKALAIAARGVPVIGLVGVNGWQRKGEPRADLDLIPWEDVEVPILFDSDQTTNPNVWLAAQKFAAELAGRGARPSIRIVPAGPNGQKQGVDDWLGTDREADDLLALPTLDPEAVYPADPDVRKATRGALVRKTGDREAEIKIAAASIELPPPEFDISLAEATAKPNEPVRFSIEELHPRGANTVVVGPQKVGKTTLLANLAGVRADGGHFLGMYAVDEVGPGRSVGVWNVETLPMQLERWFRAMPIEHPDRIKLYHLRGYAIPLTTPAGEDAAVEWLRRHNVEHWILDPIGPVLDWCGLDENENDHVKRLTVSLDRIKARAKVPDLTIGAHPKRGGEEDVRGAVRWGEWADATWALSWDGSHASFYVVSGRDVDRWKDAVRLDRDEATRTSTLTAVTRTVDRQRRDAAEVCAVLAQEDGLNAGALKARITGDKNKGGRDEKVQAAIALGWIRFVDEGQGRAKRHYLMSEEWTNHV